MVDYKQSATATTRSLESRLMDSVSVLDYGADPTGVADSTTAIQAALDTGKSVDFPKGVYLVSGTGVEVNQTGVVPGQGDGMRVLSFNGSTLKLDTGCTLGLQIRNSDFVRVTDLKLDMNNQTSAIGIAHSGGWYVYMQNIHSILANVDDTSQDLYINGGTTYPTGGAALWGAYTSEYHNLHLKRMVVAGDPSGGYVTTLNFFNLSVQPGVIAGAPGRGVAMNDVGAINFYSPTLQTCTDAFYLTGSNSNVRIYNAYVEGTTNYLNGTGTNADIYSLYGQISVSGTYNSLTLTGQYALDDDPVGRLRQQYTDDILRGRLGYVAEQKVQNKDVAKVCSDTYSVEPGGSGNTELLLSHQYLPESTSPLKVRYRWVANRGDQGVTCMNMIFDAGTGKPFIGFGANSSDPTAGIDTDTHNIRIRQSIPPATTGAAGTTGEIRWDTGYIYICTATNTWKRVAVAVW